MSNCQRKFSSVCLFPKTCTEMMEKECKHFKPYPPCMTEEEFAKKQTELLKDIPKELHSALSYMAYERGHSAGLEEIIGDLQDLVSGLQQPLRDYEARVRMDCLNRVS